MPRGTLTQEQHKPKYRRGGGATAGGRRATRTTLTKQYLRKLKLGPTGLRLLPVAPYGGSGGEVTPQNLSNNKTYSHFSFCLHDIVAAHATLTLATLRAGSARDLFALPRTCGNSEGLALYGSGLVGIR